MTTEEFFAFLDEVNVESAEVMRGASREYASDDDKFFNFRMVAALIGQNPRLFHISQDDLAYIVASIYYLKHVFSIVRGVSEREDMRGRFIDARNYTDLIHGMWDETRSPDVQAAKDMQSQVDENTSVTIDMKAMLAKAAAVLEGEKKRKEAGGVDIK